MKLTLVIPLLNEIDSISPLQEQVSQIESRLSSVGHEIEIILCDNRSDDGSTELMKTWKEAAENVVHQRFQSRLTFQQSILKGFKLATGDCLVVFQGDLQDPWAVVLDFFEAWLNGDKVVVGISTNQHSGSAQTFLRSVFYRSLRAGSSGSMVVGFQDFYLLDRTVYQELAKRPNHFQFIRGAIAREFPIDRVIKYSRGYREHGRSKFRLGDKYELALDALLVHSQSFSRALSVVGLSLCLVALAFLLFSAVAGILGVDFGVPGWLSIMSVLALILGFGSFVSAIQFEYLRRLLVLTMDSSSRGR